MIRKIVIAAAFLAAGIISLSASGSTTGGDILGLVPAPKFLKGSIENNIYTAQDKSFTVQVPHAQGSYEYTYMKVKEQLLDHGEQYVSFGPAAFNQSIYRVDYVARITPGSMVPAFEDVAPKFIEAIEQEAQQAYGGAPTLVSTEKTQVKGHDAYHWQMKQEVPAGKLGTDAVTLSHDIYSIDLGYALVTLWVQEQAGVKADYAGITTQQFVDSFTPLLPVTAASEKTTADGIYSFSDPTVKVTSPAVLCGVKGLAVYDDARSHSVDFVAPDYLWQIAGDFSVQSFPIAPSITDQASFMAQSQKSFPQYVANDRRPLGVNPTVTESKETQVDGMPAFQSSGVDAGKAMVVGTVVLQKSRITIAEVVYPLHGATDANAVFPWECYKKFVESVKETD